MIESSFVIEFGCNVQSDNVILELDSTLNVNPDGSEKTTFYPGDIVHFLLTHSDDLYLEEMKCTSGSIVYVGPAIRSYESQLLFLDDSTEHQISYPRISNISTEFYGNQVTVRLKDNNIIYSPSGIFPAIADVSYSVSLTLFKLLCPSPVLSDKNDTWPIAIVAYMGSYD